MAYTAEVWQEKDTGQWTGFLHFKPDSKVNGNSEAEIINKLKMLMKGMRK